MGLLENLSAWWNERLRRSARVRMIRKRLRGIECRFRIARIAVSTFEPFDYRYEAIICPACSHSLYVIDQERDSIQTTSTRNVRSSKERFLWKNEKALDQACGSWCFICDAHLEDRIIEEELKVLPVAVLRQQIVATQKLQAEVLAAHAAKMQRLDAEVAAKTGRLRELEGSSQFPQGGYRGVPVSTTDAL